MVKRLVDAHRLSFFRLRLTSSEIVAGKPRKVLGEKLRSVQYAGPLPRVSGPALRVAWSVYVRLHQVLSQGFEYGSGFGPSWIHPIALDSQCGRSDLMVLVLRMFVMWNFGYMPHQIIKAPFCHHNGDKPADLQRLQGRNNPPFTALSRMKENKWPRARPGSIRFL